jgi:hypothetical protein
MTAIHENSPECTLGQLDLFKIIPTQLSLEKSNFNEYFPISSIRKGSTIEFSISGDGDFYLDLSESLMYATVKITEADGSELKDPTHVKPTPLLLSSLFSQVDVFLNGKLLSSASDTNAYRSYLETLLNYGHSAKSSQLSAALLKPNQINTEHYKNPIDLIGRLHADIFLQRKLLLNHIDLKLRFVPSNSKFCLQTIGQVADTFKPQIEIINFSLFIKRVKPSPTILNAHAAVLENGGTAKYNFRRTEIRSHAIPVGSKTAHIDSVFNGQLPVRIVIGLVENSAFSGDYKTSPFFFEDNNLCYLSLTADGEEVYGKPLQPDFKNNNYIRSYFTLFTGTGSEFRDTGNDISRKDYKNGNVLYCFDLTQDKQADCSSHINLIHQGSVRLELKFADALAKVTNAVIYGEFESLMEIDKYRNVTVDF